MIEKVIQMRRIGISWHEKQSKKKRWLWNVVLLPLRIRKKFNAQHKRFRFFFSLIFDQTRKIYLRNVLPMRIKIEQKNEKKNTMRSVICNRKCVFQNRFMEKFSSNFRLGKLFFFLCFQWLLKTNFKGNRNAYWFAGNVSTYAKKRRENFISRIKTSKKIKKNHYLKKNLHFLLIFATYLSFFIQSRCAPTKWQTIKEREKL